METFGGITLSYVFNASTKMMLLQYPCMGWSGQKRKKHEEEFTLMPFSLILMESSVMGLGRYWIEVEGKKDGGFLLGRGDLA